jgi:hypothetical protein
MNQKYKNIEQWVKRIQKAKEGDVDLSRDEDLSIALMNLVSLEEHFYFTALKTDNQKYLELMKSIREMRKKYLAVIVKDPKGEEWCISKHLLAASMRLYEVGTKELSTKGHEASFSFFQSAFDLWSMFFAINMNLIGTEKLDQVDIKNEGKNVSKFSVLMKKIIDCCKEW